MPSPGSPPQSESRGESQGEQGEPSDSTSTEQGRQQAGGDLQAAGERVAQAGENLGKQGSDSGEAADAAQGGNQPEDPFLPEMDPTVSQSDDLVFEESESGGPAGGDLAASETGNMNDGAAGDPAAGDPAAGDPAAGDPAAGSDNPAGAEETMETAGGPAGGEISDEIRAAQEALIEAGIRLQEAGAAVAGATSDADLERARELLAEARIIAVVAGQDLMDAKASAGDSDLYQDAEDALNEANAAIVIATQAVEGMPDFEDMQTAGVPSRSTELEDELEDSLGDFDKQILTARRTVLQPAGNREPALPPADEEDMAAGIPGSQTAEPGLAETADMEGGDAEGPPEPGSLPVSRDNDGGMVAAADVPEDIGPGNDDDIVAQQLREAAMAETDPDLREKLWEEYRRYKSGL